MGTVCLKGLKNSNENHDLHCSFIESRKDLAPTLMRRAGMEPGWHKYVINSQGRRVELDDRQAAVKIQMAQQGEVPRQIVDDYFREAVDTGTIVDLESLYKSSVLRWRNHCKRVQAAGRGESSERPKKRT